MLQLNILANISNFLELDLPQMSILIRSFQNSGNQWRG